MKLFTLDNSPFAARVRIQIRHKGLAIEMVEPPEELRTEAFRAAYPLGKVPALELDDGQMIAESTAIMNYLETQYPDIPMRPSAALQQAHNEMLVRYTDNHLSLGLSPLFQEFFGLMHSQHPPAQRADRFDALVPELEKLESLLTQLPSFKKRDLQTGDLCVVGNLAYASELASFFGKHDLLDRLSTIREWREWVMAFPAVTTEIDIMIKSYKAKLNVSVSQGGNA